jgi:hypothetical protein
MPRQPFKPFADRNRGGHLDIGTQAIGQRPELEAVIGKCLMAWPHAEAEMALLLGQLLGASNAAALAVFQALRRSSAQRLAISEAANATLDSTDLELLNAVLNAHKAIEANRNDLCHGHFGVYSNLPDGILWYATGDYIAFKASMTLAGDARHDDIKRDKLYSKLYYYKKPDLDSIYNNINQIAWIWYEMINYLREKSPRPRAELYRQLCDRPHIAQGLETLRRKNIPPTPP